LRHVSGKKDRHPAIGAVQRPNPTTAEHDTMIARRTFLGLVGGATAAHACSADGAAPVDVGNVAAGAASALPVSSLTAVSGEPVCLGRDARGVYAMTLICTHQGCDMGQRGSVSAQGLVCGCHGSEFDAEGNVVRGPAMTALAHFAVSVDASGNLTVDTSSEVDPSTRLVVA
jgi:nitrite reductase/ring-hydroxylating ferredoxin subunit